MSGTEMLGHIMITVVGTLSIITGAIGIGILIINKLHPMPDDVPTTLSNEEIIKILKKHTKENNNEQQN